MSTPARLAPDIVEAMDPGGAAVVFGPEEAGLTNEEIELCGRLMAIPTSGDATSLNLAQAAVIVLYECFKNAPGKAFRPSGPSMARPATHAEMEVLFATLKDTLLDMDFLQRDNPDYWMLPLRRFLTRYRLRHNEFKLLMGVCRQTAWALKNPRAPNPAPEPDPEPQNSDDDRN